MPSPGPQGAPPGMRGAHVTPGMLHPGHPGMPPLGMAHAHARLHGLPHAIGGMPVPDGPPFGPLPGARDGAALPLGAFLPPPAPGTDRAGGAGTGPYGAPPPVWPAWGAVEMGPGMGALPCIPEARAYGAAAAFGRGPQDLGVAQQAAQQAHAAAAAAAWAWANRGSAQADARRRAAAQPAWRPKPGPLCATRAQRAAAAAACLGGLAPFTPEGGSGRGDDDPHGDAHVGRDAAGGAGGSPGSLGGGGAPGPPGGGGGASSAAAGPGCQPGAGLTVSLPPPPSHASAGQSTPSPHAGPSPRGGLPPSTPGSRVSSGREAGPHGGADASSACRGKQDARARAHSFHGSAGSLSSSCPEGASPGPPEGVRWCGPAPGGEAGADRPGRACATPASRGPCGSLDEPRRGSSQSETLAMGDPGTHHSSRGPWEAGAGQARVADAGAWGPGARGAALAREAAQEVDELSWFLGNDDVAASARRLHPGAWAGQ